MKSTSFSSVACSVACGLAIGVSASPHPHVARLLTQGSIEGWAPGGDDDFRGPCPMMNTLANHGYLNHDGRNLTEDVVVSALKNGINFDEELGTIMFQSALSAVNPDADFFTLDLLNQHNVLEHDASLSRSDAFFGNNHVFNETVFEESIQYWPKEILDTNQLAMSKLARQVRSKALNPDYTFLKTTEPFSVGELAAPILVFGDLTTSTVNRTLVEFFFRNEKLPAELGWTPQAAPVTLTDSATQSSAISAALDLFTNSTTTAAARRRAAMVDIHAVFMS